MPRTLETGIKLYTREDYTDLWLTIFDQIFGAGEGSNMNVINSYLLKLNEHVSNYYFELDSDTNQLYVSEKLESGAYTNRRPLGLMDSSGHIASKVDGTSVYIDTDGVLHGVSADAVLNEESTNAIQNKAVTTAIKDVKDSIKTITDAKGTKGGYAELDSNGFVPSSQLPSYVDDVLEGIAQGVTTDPTTGANSATGFVLIGEVNPCTPESGKIYVDISTNIQYRWSGTFYISTGSSLALGETSATAYRGDRGKVAYDHAQTTGNPHETTAADVGAIPVTDKGKAGGVATLNDDGKVSADQLEVDLSSVAQLEDGKIKVENLPDNVVLYDPDAEPGESLPIDADRLDGHDASYFATSESFNKYAKSVDTIGDNLDKHTLSNITTANGVHGLRFYNNKLAYNNGSGWSEIKTGGGVSIVVDVHVETGSKITVTMNGSIVSSATASSDTTRFEFEEYGTYKFTATKDGMTSDTASVTASASGLYECSLGYFTATIKVLVEKDSKVFLSDGQTATATTDNVVLSVHKTGVYTVYATKDTGKTATKTVTVSAEDSYETSLSYAVLTVTSPVGSDLTVSKDSNSYNVTSKGADKFYLPETGSWKVAIAKDGETADDTVAVSEYKAYTKDIAFVHIYGVTYDGTSTTKWTRTDESEKFVDPVPYVSGSTTYSSPFDNLAPWSGMKVSTRTGGEMVSIPKFWYKMEQTGNAISIKIADKKVEGYYVSPAHMDRGDGNGEHDVVYVGRYHCISGYKSTKGSNPLANITRSAARTGCHGVGTNYWQFDFATRVTLWLLYLVEFADWNSQAKIGYGCGNGSSAQAVGSASTMPYHTGTMQTARTTYGVGVQYRYIEGLWDNVYDWVDGCYYNASGLNIILDPNKFSDSTNGTAVGIPDNGWASNFKVDSKAGFPLFYSAGTSGSDSTYSCDYWYFSTSNPCLFVGGYYYRSLNRGLFFVGYSAATYASADIGCRLLEIP